MHDPPSPRTTALLLTFWADKRANDDRLVELACLNHIVFLNKRFSLPQRHLLLWRSNNGHTKALSMQGGPGRFRTVGFAEAPTLVGLKAQITTCKESTFDCFSRPFQAPTTQSVSTYLGSRR